MLEAAIKATRDAGYYFSLYQNRSGKHAWSAYAVGASKESGATYIKAVGDGRTPDEAMADLVRNLKPQKSNVEDYSDLV